MPISTYISRDTLRTEFSQALSDMYRAEVPLYGELVQLVDDINGKVVKADQGMMGGWQYSDRLNVERHGAIRLGLPSELQTISRLFALLGMYPVGYYDLSTSGVPVHSTAFRPIDPSSLCINPFRVFTSLLRPDLIPFQLREECMNILSKREIFHPGLIPLIGKAEKQGGLERKDASDLVRFGLETFRWHERSLVSKETYGKMRKCHPLLADIVGFRGPHVNHLTPRVLDIDLAQKGMGERGIPPKDIIEGPPHRLCPILLRQTSFKALTEPILFAEFDAEDILSGISGEGDGDGDGDQGEGYGEVFEPGSLDSVGSQSSRLTRSSRRSSGGEMGSHRARFGEIESRGAALTRKGHDLYLSLLTQVPSKPKETNEGHQLALRSVFDQFPDTWDELRRQNLAYFRYFLSSESKSGEYANTSAKATLDELIQEGVVSFEPIVYEDFLPASAAGIFQSNLAESIHAASAKGTSGVSGRATPRQGLGDTISAIPTIPNVILGNTDSYPDGERDILMDETIMLYEPPVHGADQRGGVVEEQDGMSPSTSGISSKEVFELALGEKVQDYWELYEGMQRASLECVAKDLGMDSILD